MELRISERMWSNLTDELFARPEVESAGVILAEVLPTMSGKTIVAREAYTFDEGAYLVRNDDRLSIDPIAMNRLIRPARNHGWSVFTIHTHPFSTHAWFSEADDFGDSQLMPSLQNQISGVPHGSIVLTPTGAATARVFDSNVIAHEVTLHIPGRTVPNKHETQSESEGWYARQRLALGRDGQEKLRRIRVAVVGLGGIGSVVSAQLAHLGVGELLLIDGDVLETSNLSRVFGALKSDVGKTPKVNVAARYAENLGLQRHVDTIPEFLQQSHVEVLAECDVVVLCVDKQTPRAILNRFAYSYAVPVIDLGVVFRIDETGAVVGDAGRIVVIGPDRPCLACWGHLDGEVLRNEAISPLERDKLENEGYLLDTDEPEPSVMAFNTTVAGAGAVELLRLVTGFAGAEQPPNRLALSFSEATMRRNGLARASSRCHICGRAPAD